MRILGPSLALPCPARCAAAGLPAQLRAVPVHRQQQRTHHHHRGSHQGEPWGEGNGRGWRRGTRGVGYWRHAASAVSSLGHPPSSQQTCLRLPNAQLLIRTSTHPPAPPQIALPPDPSALPPAPPPTAPRLPRPLARPPPLCLLSACPHAFQGVVAVFLGFFLLGGVKFSAVNVAGISLNTLGERPGQRREWRLGLELYRGVVGTIISKGRCTSITP